MNQPLMPRATAVWLVENTALTFDQIAEFCSLHPLEVQGIADEEVAHGILGQDPVSRGELTMAEIERCSTSPDLRLEMAEQKNPPPQSRAKGPRYTPVTKRQEKPNAIAWLVRNHPELSDAQIGRLVGTTKPTINAIRDRTHWNISNITPQDPVTLGLCTQTELSADVAKALDKAARKRAKDGIVDEPEVAPEPDVMAIVAPPEPRADDELVNPFGDEPLEIPKSDRDEPIPDPFAPRED